MKRTKPLRIRLVKKLDALWSKKIHDKFKNKCVMCGATGITHAHHSIVTKGRGGFGVRWLILNGVLLCPVCHLFKIHHGQADKMWLDRYVAILNEITPPAEQQNICEIAHHITKFSTAELQEMVLHFEETIVNFISFAVRSTPPVARRKNNHAQ